ncbi:glycosyltransferase [bacterium]|nr:glycosyltransferase [bacterium]
MLGRSDDRPRAWEADVVDDLAFNRPWNLVIKLLRIVALLRIRRLRSGVTVVIVNWNTREVTRDVLQAVQVLTKADVEVMIVDNGSTDGSREWLGREFGIRRVFLPANAGHAIALDIATLIARTDTVVTLDSDAIPLEESWLDVVLEPMKKVGVILAGLRGSRDFVHPVFLAVDVRSFIRRRLSFQVFREPGVTNEAQVWGVNSWDTGELMTKRLEVHEVAFVEPTPNLVEGLPGMTVGAVVYHHGGVTRATESDVDDDSYTRWRSAIEALLPSGALHPVSGRDE